MKKFLFYGVAAVVLFGISAGASLWLQTHNKENSGEKGHANATRSAYGSRSDGESKAFRPLTGMEVEKPAVEEPAPRPRERDKAGADKDEKTSQALLKLEMVRQQLRNERADLEKLRKQVQDEVRELTRLSMAAPPAIVDPIRPADYSTPAEPKRTYERTPILVPIPPVAVPYTR